MISLEIPFGKGVVGLSAQRKRKINITGIKRKKEYVSVIATNENSVSDKLPGLPDAESQVAIPLLSNNELIAVLTAESENFCVFSDDAEEFLVTLTQPLAVSIQNSLLYDSMEEKIRDRTAEIEKLNKTKEKFFSIISHDLRSPVTSVQSSTGLFRYYNQRGETQKIDELCSKVDNSINRLNHLLDNLLNWSLRQTNGIECHFERIHLKNFIDEVAEIYENNFLSKSLIFKINIDNDIFILADRHTLATVFRNLFSNAIKFTPKEGAISISAQLISNSVVIALQDSGVGIDEEKLNSIFEFKERKATTGTEKERGTGLGLVLVKEFLCLNKGTIAIESRPQSGTLITVTLPMAN
jgi:signal transduction histidine kinase